MVSLITVCNFDYIKVCEGVVYSESLTNPLAWDQKIFKFWVCEWCPFLIGTSHMWLLECGKSNDPTGCLNLVEWNGYNEIQSLKSKPHKAVGSLLLLDSQQTFNP